MAELGREFPEVKKEGYGNNALQKNQLSKSKRNQTGNDPDPARMLEAAETQIQERTRFAMS